MFRTIGWLLGLDDDEFTGISKGGYHGTHEAWDLIDKLVDAFKRHQKIIKAQELEIQKLKTQLAEKENNYANTANNCKDADTANN